MAAPRSYRRQRPEPSKGPDRLAEALDLLQSGVSEITSAEDFRRYLDLAARFHRYSARNCLLILAQRPDASRVAGYRAWQAMGRQVRKGEKGISILAPVSHTKKDEATGEKTRALSGFRAASVFDVSQTDGEPLPEAPKPEALDDGDPNTGDPNTGDPETAARILQGLSRMCATEGVALEERELGPGYYGHYEPAAGRSPRVVLSSRLSPTERAITLAHELAHHLQRTTADQKEPTTKAAQETEAEGAAFVLCSYFGLDTSRFSFAYIARYARTPEALAQSLERVQKAAPQARGGRGGLGVRPGREAVLVAALFALGRVVATPGALEVLRETGADPLSLLARHVSGDWGALHLEDVCENERSIREGSRVLSSYPVGECGGLARVWIITEADRSSTCVLLPGEY